MADEKTTPAAPQFKRKRSITLATLKFEVDKPLYVLLLGRLHKGKQRVGRSGAVKLDSSGQPRQPPTLVEVIDLMTKEVAQIIAATIINTELAESYPNDGYVGLAFSITKQKRKEGREYDPYDIAEIEFPPELQPVADEAKKKVAAEIAKEKTDAEAIASAESATPEPPSAASPVGAAASPPRRR